MSLLRIRENYLAFGKPHFGDREVEAVTRILRSGWVGMGGETEAFEAELANFLGVPHVVTVNSCTSALFLSLLVLGVKAGDEVICPSLTWCATANAALYLGAQPVFCDIDPETLCVTPNTIAEKISSRTRAVIVVHFGGLAVDVAAIRRVIPPSIAIVEDAAHAFGANYPDGRMVGSSGNLVCFSFYANKNLSTGEGGAIALYDPDLASRLIGLRQHGLSSDAWKRYIHPAAALVPKLSELGYKMNYTDLQAAIGRVQLSRQGEFRALRKAIAQRYVERLASSGFKIRFQRELLSEAHARHLVVALLPLEHLSLGRDELVIEMRRRNAGASIHYAPLHRMPLYGQQTVLPGTDYVTARNVTLPISASMTVADADYVCDHFLDLLDRGQQYPLRL